MIKNDQHTQQAQQTQQTQQTHQGDVICPKCTSLSLKKFKTKDYNRRTSQEQFTYYKCTGCQLLFLFPIPNGLESYYCNDYHHIPSSPQEIHQWAQVEDYKIKILKNFSSQGRLLDIGPSWGGFPYLAKQEGFEVEAIEMNERCAQFLNDTLKIRTFQSSDIAATLAQSKPYDIITLWHVIEHLPDPWIILKSLFSALSPNGILIIAAPNPDALQLRLFRHRWTHIDAPRHLELLPTELLIDYLEPLGYKLLLNTTVDDGSLGWNRFGWEYSLSNFSTVPLIKKGLGFLGRATCKLVRPLERKGLSGSTYTLVFRKEK
jgi:2-polyprenyl-3-methyl-5-hydroxy-6-metoxy-1,4-benzoquinol methylase